MIKQIMLYITLSVVVSLGVGYGTGYYVASNKAENDIAAIRAILEQQESEKKAAETELEQYFKDTATRSERWRKTPDKSY